MVDWAGLTHAYGSAADTPGHLAALASPDPDVRAHALNELCGSIYHQGTVYQATPHAVPILAALLANPETPDRSLILELLWLLSTGGSYHEAHADLSIMADTRDTPEYQAAMRQEQEWVAELRLRLAEHLPLYLRLLGDPETDVRLWASQLLSRFPQAAGALEEPVKEAYREEPDPAVRANTLVALSRLGLPLPVRTRETPLEQLVRALLEGRCQAILPFLESGDLAEEYSRLPATGEFDGDLARALGEAGPELRDRALDTLLKRVRGRKHWFDGVADGLLSLALAERSEDLTPRQKEVVRLVALQAWPSPRGIYCNMVDVLQAHGLPTRLPEMEALLGAPL
ncbi:MAG: hypothetical protein AB1758_11800, partial [Candidatus Eremiobacterota bacterium]